VNKDKLAKLNHQSRIYIKIFKNALTTNFEMRKNKYIYEKFVLFKNIFTYLCE